MRATFLKGVALGSAVSLATLAATAAFAGTGVGQVFNLGQENRANARSELEGKTPSAVLNVTNTDRSAAASGVSIDVPSNDPPLVVNSATKVKNLNADMVDGQHVSQLQAATSMACPNGTAIASITPNGTTACNGSVVLPIDEHVAPDATVNKSFTPSSLSMHFACGLGADIELVNSGAAPASAHYWFSVANNPMQGADVTLQAGGDVPINASPWMGQVVYFDQTTVATANIAASGGNAVDGCDYHGTVDLAPRSS